MNDLFTTKSDIVINNVTLCYSLVQYDHSYLVCQQPETRFKIDLMKVLDMSLSRNQKLDNSMTIQHRSDRTASSIWCSRIRSEDSALRL